MTTMTVPRRETLVSCDQTIVQREETTVPLRDVYRLLRRVDRDHWSGEANAR